MIAMVFMVILVLIYLWWRQPRTPREFFEVRCSGCHDLQVKRLCEFPRELRPGIVDVMRRDQGADEMISEQEALMIKQYLRRDFQCP